MPLAQPDLSFGIPPHPVLADVAAQLNTPVVNTPQSATSSTTTTQAAYWSGVWIPQSNTDTSCLPMTAGVVDPAKDWDPTFDDANSTYPKVPLHLPTISGEYIGATFFGDCGPVRHRMTVNVKGTHKINAKLFMYCGDVSVPNGYVQVKLNGQIIGSYTLAVGPAAPTTNDLSFTLTEGNNTLSIARSIGVETVLLGCAYFGPFVSWVAP